MAKGKSKGSKLVVNFDKMEEGGSRIPDGRYIAKIVSYEVKDGEQYEYIAVKFEIVSGDYKGKNLYENFSLSPKALFKLRDLLVGLGVAVPKKAINLDLDALVGKFVGVEVEESEYTYKGKTKKKSEITAFLLVTKQGKQWVITDGSSSDEDEDEDDDDEVEDDEEDEDDDEDEDDEEEEETPPPPPAKKKGKK